MLPLSGALCFTTSALSAWRFSQRIIEWRFSLQEDVFLSFKYGSTS